MTITKNAIDAHIKFGEIAKNYGTQYNPETLKDKYPSNHFRLEIVRDILKRCQPKNILDAGCGAANPLIKIRNDINCTIEGFDYAKEMVEKSHKNLEAAGLDKSLVKHGNIADMQNYKDNHYDCVLALGVVYYMRDFKKAMQNLVDKVKPNGKIIFSLRNELLSMFSLNNYTEDFFINTLIDKENLPSELAAEVKIDLANRFHQPKIKDKRFNTVDERNVYSIYHNPLTIEQEILKPLGLKQDGQYFYHFHALPPQYEHTNTEAFRKASTKLEQNPTDWRGIFTSSAFVVEATKIV